jgi:hypothetical protein
MTRFCCSPIIALAPLVIAPVMAVEPPANVTATSKLPTGAGLAQEFPADRNIATHPAVIFSEDFEKESFRDRWDSTRDKDGKVLSLTDPGDPRLGKRALRVTATLGENTGGGATQWFESSETIFVRFYCRFHPQCDYVHHFVTLRANKSLQGKDKWSGFGGAGLKPDGGGRFSTALEPWGDWGRNTAPGRWNFYTYWHEMKKSPDGKYWGNGFRPAGQKDIPKDQWLCAEFMLKHNEPGQANGEQAFWIDGQLGGHWKGFNWRTSADLRANALTLETYITDRWTKNPVNIVDFDNLVIAREYIGPTPAPK